MPDMDPLTLDRAAAPEEQPRTQIVVVGHVDHGKSTVIGRLLAIVPWVAAHDGPEVAEVCRRFEVEETELLDDLGLLFLCGVHPFTPDVLIDVDVDDGRVEQVDRRLQIFRIQATRQCPWPREPPPSEQPPVEWQTIAAGNSAGLTWRLGIEKEEVGDCFR